MQTLTKPIDKVVARITEMTHDNDHTGARIYLCKVCQVDNFYTDLLLYIQQDILDNGHLTHLAGLVRNRVEHELWAYLSTRLNPDHYQRIYAAF